MSKKWLSPKPAKCEICLKTFHTGDVFIDGRTIHGGLWALMCNTCHSNNGGQLGIGYGQKYDWETCNLIKGDKNMDDDIDRDDPVYDTEDDQEPEEDRDED